MEKASTKSNRAEIKSCPGKGVKSLTARRDENPGSTGRSSQDVKNPGNTGSNKQMTMGDKSSASNSETFKEKESKPFSGYKKESTVFLHIDGDNVSKDDLLDHIEALCGEDCILACVPRGNRTDYEVTLTDSTKIQLLVPEFQIAETTIKARPIFQSAVVVSVMHLPSYTTDEEIITKIESHKVQIVSPIYRRYYKRKTRKIADGTRYMRVKFPKEVCSLPYALKFDVNGGKEYFRTIHSDQIKVCNRCLSPEHTVRYCDQNQCFLCKKYGHISLDCPFDVCEDCKKKDCECDSDSERGDNFRPLKKQKHLSGPQTGDGVVESYLKEQQKRHSRDEKENNTRKETETGESENITTEEDEMEETETSEEKETVFGDLFESIGQQQNAKSEDTKLTENIEEKEKVEANQNVPKAQRDAKRKGKRVQQQPYNTKSKNKPSPGHNNQK